MSRWTERILLLTGIIILGFCGSIVFSQTFPNNPASRWVNAVLKVKEAGTGYVDMQGDTSGYLYASQGNKGALGNAWPVQLTDLTHQLAFLVPSDAESASEESVPVLAQLLGFNGTTWDRVRVDASKNLDVDLQTAIPTGANVIGGVTANLTLVNGNAVATAGNGIQQVSVTAGNTSKNYYTASLNITSTIAGDNYCVLGDGTHTFYLTLAMLRIEVSGTTAPNVSIVLRSTKDSGGTSSAGTVGLTGTAEAAANETTLSYSVAPTNGTFAGYLAEDALAASLTSAANPWATYSASSAQPEITVGGTSEVCLNSGASGANVLFMIEWHD